MTFMENALNFLSKSFSCIIVTLSQDFEKKVEIGLRLNSKLSEFAKTLSPEEQRGLGALARLAEFAIENGGVALFGLENRGIPLLLMSDTSITDCEF